MNEVEALREEVALLSDRLSTMESLHSSEKTWRKLDRHQQERFITSLLIGGMAISVLFGTGFSYSRAEGFQWKLNAETLAVIFGGGSIAQVGLSVWKDKKDEDRDAA